jgi:hypothetical protein
MYDKRLTMRDLIRSCYCETEFNIRCTMTNGTHAQNDTDPSYFDMQACRDAVIDITTLFSGKIGSFQNRPFLKGHPVCGC